MVSFITMMKMMILVLLVCAVPLFASKEELPGNKLSGPEAAGGAPGSLSEQDAPEEPVILHSLRQVRKPHPYADKPHKEHPVLLTLNGLDEPLTQKYIEQFQGKSGKRFLTMAVERSEPYLAFVRNEVEKRRLPHELIYLPVIESAYQVNAVSRAGATGLWQFMRNSIGPYNMKINEWMDERRDFWKSTLGALDMLESGYKRLGSWELALAAYNAGMGTVLNAKKRYPDADYWELCRLKAFKNETIHYVPKLIAASLLLSNPRRFGFDPVWPEDPRWTRIPAGRSVDLGLVAEHAGLSDFDLKKANRELTYGITPPDPGYHIKVPAAHAPAIVSVLEDPDLTLIRYHIHTIQSGDTLSGIARRYGVTESQIRSNNQGVSDKSLKVGMRLIIPALREINLAAARQEPTPARAAAPPNRTHLVKRGETLWAIARAYNTSPENLARLNGIKLNDTLRIGSTLKTP